MAGKAPIGPLGIICRVALLLPMAWLVPSEEPPVPRTPGRKPATAQSQPRADTAGFITPIPEAVSPGRFDSDPGDAGFGLDQPPWPSEGPDDDAEELTELHGESHEVEVGTPRDSGASAKRAAERRFRELQAQAKTLASSLGAARRTRDMVMEGHRPSGQPLRWNDWREWPGLLADAERRLEAARVDYFTAGERALDAEVEAGLRTRADATKKYWQTEYYFQLKEIEWAEGLVAKIEGLIERVDTPRSDQRGYTDEWGRWHTDEGLLVGRPGEGDPFVARMRVRLQVANERLQLAERNRTSVINAARQDGAEPGWFR
jgi:hypothetical protein